MWWWQDQMRIEVSQRKEAFITAAVVDVGCCRPEEEELDEAESDA